MNKTYEEWLKYYQNATKEQVVEDMYRDIQEIKQLKEELDRYKWCNPKKIEIIELENLQQRIDKAIGLLELAKESGLISIRTILQILKGDKEK